MSAWWCIALFGVAVNGYACNASHELTTKRHIDLRVRMATSSPGWKMAFTRALNLYASILDLNWKIDDSETCNVEIRDGSAREFLPLELAFSVPELNLIEVNPAKDLTPNEMYLVGVHELGHLLGLRHSNNSKSVMYCCGVPQNEVLDNRDMKQLAKRHALRIALAQ